MRTLFILLMFLIIACGGKPQTQNAILQNDDQSLRQYRNELPLFYGVTGPTEQEHLKGIQTRFYHKSQSSGDFTYLGMRAGQVNKKVVSAKCVLTILRGDKGALVNAPAFVSDGIPYCQITDARDAHNVTDVKLVDVVYKK